MYEDDTPSEAAASHLKRDIIEEIVFTPELRPHITQAIIQEFTHKIQRTFPGYAPPPHLNCWTGLKKGL